MCVLFTYFYNNLQSKPSNRFNWNRAAKRNAKAYGRDGRGLEKSLELSGMRWALRMEHQAVPFLESRAPHKSQPSAKDEKERGEAQPLQLRKWAPLLHQTLALQVLI